jgi:hypothetical protein
MFIVFSGLVLISVAIVALPKILAFIARITEKEEVISPAAIAAQEAENEEKDLASVIGLVMQMEAARNETAEEKEEIDIANVIGLVLHLEQERCYGLPN